MDFDDLTQRLLEAFLRNSTRLQHDRHVPWRSIAAAPQDSVDHSSRDQWPPPTASHTLILPLPKPERLQSEAAQLNHDSEGNILYDIFLHSRDHTETANATWPGYEGDSDSTVSRLYLLDFIIGILLAIVTLATVIGNALVIAAILRERHLRSVGNYLVFSLAIADLMVACLVMPLSALYVVTGEWTLGTFLCDVWTSADVLCCTASILHLLAIAIDRYWAVTNVDYIHQRRNGTRIGIMILMIWSASIVISVAPIFGWRDPEFPMRIAQRQCLISQDVTYQIFATCASFYVPLLLILLLYWRIYQVARKRIRRKPGNKVTLMAMQSASNASNANNVENKVIKGMAGVSKTSRKLAKYSAAKYLQKPGARMHSDMMSLDTEHCLHGSADSLASEGSTNPNGCGNARCNKPATAAAADATTTGSPVSTSHLKKLSISSMARTTTTSLTMVNTSDHSTCSNLGHAVASTQNGNRYLSCTKADSTAGGYSIIAEEGSSSSSNAQHSSSVRCSEHKVEPDLNEHSPLPLSPDLAHRANRAELDLNFGNELERPPKRYSLAQDHSRRGASGAWPMRTKSLSVCPCTNDANQGALCSQMEEAFADRYRAQSNESIAKRSVGHCTVNGEGTVVSVAGTASDSANRVNNSDAGIGGDGCAAECVVDCYPSDSNLIAIDTNYCRIGENGRSAAIAVHNDIAGGQKQTILTSDHSDASRATVAHCNHSANGGLTESAQPASGRNLIANDHKPAAAATLKEDSTSSSGSTSHQHSNHHKEKHHKKSKSLKQSSQHSNPSPSPHQSRLYQKESIESKRERKAAKTLAIITGVFVICWLPFFINAILSPLSKTYQDFVPSILTDIFLWAGYINSCVNPIIYTIFSPDFRTAFKKMLLGKKTVRSPKGWSNKGMSRV